jgi:hypothetical protein
MCTNKISSHTINRLRYALPVAVIYESSASERWGWVAVSVLIRVGCCTRVLCEALR